MFRSAISHALAGGVTLAILIANAPQLSLDSPELSARSRQARERVLYVNVFDADTHKPVTGLGPDAFVVREDGVRREVLRVSAATTPMPVALLVDNTQGATNAIADIRRALTTFIARTQGLGPLAIVMYADRPTIVTDYTTDTKALQNGVGKVFAMPGSGSTLLDAIKEVARGLRKRETDRASVVVLTTEHTEFSTLHYAQVIDDLKTSGASLHAVVLLNPGGSLASDEARNRATVLDRGPRETGGVRFDLLAASAFDGQLQDLAEILKNQYRVVYARPESLIPPEKIEVSMVKAGLEAHGAPARDQTRKQ